MLVAKSLKNSAKCHSPVQKKPPTAGPRHLANALFMPGERFQPFLIVLGPFLGPKWFWRVLPASFLTQEPGIGLVDLEEALIGLVTDLWSNHDGRRLERYR